MSWPSCNKSVVNQTDTRQIPEAWIGACEE